MSLTFETMPPAGPVLSIESRGTTCSFPFSTACGVATSGVELRKATPVPLSVMPSGVRMRSLMKSSQLCPVTAGTISPAAMYSTLS